MQIGDVIGHVTLINKERRFKNGISRWWWYCVCKCGAQFWRIAQAIGSNASCGCSARHPKKHGMRNTPEYKAWRSMKERCLNPRHPCFYLYGGRGLKICDRWLNSFENFFADMGHRPPGLTLERQDNQKGYDRENCVWASRKAQTRNRSQSVFLTISGERIHYADAAERYKIPRATVLARHKRGWPDPACVLPVPDNGRCKARRLRVA